MHQRAFLGGGWARGGASEVVRRAHPASGAQWNVQVVRGKVNGKCLWNACKALSLGLLLMVLGAAMATIGYYADHLSIAQEVRGNHTVKIKNESRGFHLNNLSYAGPIVMGVGGFIVVAACVMTFEARDSAAKVVPARFKLSTSGPPNGPSCTTGLHSVHGSLRTSGSQTAGVQHPLIRNATDRRILTNSFLQFSRGLQIECSRNKDMLKIPQGSINKSPSAPDLVLERSGSQEQTSPTLNRYDPEKRPNSRKSFAACALLNPGLLHRHALSVDETAAPNYHRLSRESLQGSQGSMAMDLHLDCPVTLRIRDKRRNPLLRQRQVDEDGAAAHDDGSRRSSHSCSPRIPTQQLRELKSGVAGGQLKSVGDYSSTMGCASSSPLVESGKNLVDAAKENVTEAVAKGEKTLHDIGDASKNEMSSGMEHVKGAMESAMTTVENSIGTAVDKIGDTFHLTSSSVAETADKAHAAAEEAADAAVESMAEAISDAETVLASEADNAKDLVSSTAETAFEHVASAKSRAAEAANAAVDGAVEALHVEEIDEQFDMLGDSVDNAEKKVEELLNRLPTPATSPTKESKKEEPPPTFWEAAHDAILLQQNKQPNSHLDNEIIAKLSELMSKSPSSITNEDNQQNDANIKTVNHEDLYVREN